MSDSQYVKSFKDRSCYGQQSSQDDLRRVLMTKPTDLSIVGSQLDAAVTTAQEMGALIASMTTDRANYTLRIHWPADAPYGGGESANPRTPELDGGDSPNVACRPIQSDKQPEPLESVLDRIKQAAERNRRNAQIERRFGKK